MANVLFSSPRENHFHPTWKSVTVPNIDWVTYIIPLILNKEDTEQMKIAEVIQVWSEILRSENASRYAGADILAGIAVLLGFHLEYNLLSKHNQV